MSPSEQLLSVPEAQEYPHTAPVEVVTRRATASPTLFEIGGPSLEEEERGEEEMAEQSSLPPAEGKEVQ